MSGINKIERAAIEKARKWWHVSYAGAGDESRATRIVRRVESLELPNVRPMFYIGMLTGFACGYLAGKREAEKARKVSR